jgi:hypothetical protein
MSRTNAVLTGRRCLCSACGEYFSADSNFDRHRQGDHKILRVCVDPETLGMVIKQSGPSTFWGMPGNGFIPGQKNPELVP